MPYVITMLNLSPAQVHALKHLARRDGTTFRKLFDLAVSRHLPAVVADLRAAGLTNQGGPRRQRRVNTATWDTLGLVATQIDASRPALLRACLTRLLAETDQPFQDGNQPEQPPAYTPSTPEQLQLFLADLSNFLWRLTWDLKAAETRLLSPQQHRAAEDLQQALHDTKMRLWRETKPTSWRKGTRVRVTKPLDANRCPSPAPGTEGRVARTLNNIYGWWVAVTFTTEFLDTANTTWYPTTERPITIYFKEDEIERVSRPRPRRGHTTLSRMENHNRPAKE